MNTTSTHIADADAPNIQALIAERAWRELSEPDRIGAAYHYVKDEVPFGYNSTDNLPASEVLRQGYGQCNTKGNLLFTLLRALDVQVRFHGFTIEKALQRGAIPEWLFPLAPERILHSWVEVLVDEQWLPLEGFILDPDYLRAVQKSHPMAEAFCGFGVATKSLQSPNVEWRGKPTYIQREGIADDFGVFDTPDEFYAQHGTNLSGPRRLFFSRVARHFMNRNVRRIRGTR